MKQLELPKFLLKLPLFLFLAGTLLLASALAKRWAGAEAFTKEAVYERVATWIESAECTQRYGTFLLVCPTRGEHVRYVPIENVSPGDDAGHALTGNAIAAFSPYPVTLLTFVHINFFLNAIGIFCLACCLFFTGDRLVSFAVLMLGANFAIPGQFTNADVTSAHFGIASLALVPALWWLRASPAGAKTNRAWALGTAFAFLSLAASILFREPVGRLGELCALGAAFTLLPAVLREIRHSKLGPASARAAATVGCVVLAHYAIFAINAVRDSSYSADKSRAPPSHGIAHNLYIGLGDVPNAFGIIYLDSYATKKVQEIDPTAVYLSARHFEIVKQLYWETVKSNPREVARIYWEKMKKISLIEFYAGISFKDCIALLLAFTALGLCLVRPYPWAEQLLLYGFSAIYLGQGVLANASPPFVYGAKIPIVLIGLLTARLLFTRRSRLL